MIRKSFQKIRKQIFEKFHNLSFWDSIFALASKIFVTLKTVKKNSLQNFKKVILFL